MIDRGVGPVRVCGEKRQQVRAGSARAVQVGRRARPRRPSAAKMLMRSLQQRLKELRQRVAVGDLRAHLGAKLDAPLRLAQEIIDLGRKIAAIAVRHGLARVAKRADKMPLAIDQRKAAGGEGVDGLEAVAVDKAWTLHVDHDLVARKNARKLRA